MCIIAAPAAAVAAGGATAAAAQSAALAANIALATGALGAGVGLYTSYQQGQQQKAMYEYQADMVERNASLADMQAQDAIKRGELEKQQIQQSLASKTGTGRAGWGASGVALGSGSPLDWQADLAERAAYDESVADYNAKMEAWGYRVQAGGSRASAGASRVAAGNAQTGGYLNAAGSLLGGASSVAEKYYKFRS